jgi:hypothetical protein
MQFSHPNEGYSVAVPTLLRYTRPTQSVEAAHHPHGTPVLQTALCLSGIVCRCSVGPIQPIKGGWGTVGSEFGVFF